MKSAHLILCFLLCLGWNSIEAQQNCKTDLDCFLKAVKKGKAASFLHRDAFFFVPLSDAVDQQWSVDGAGSFSMQLEGEEFMYRFLEEALKQQKYYSDKKWKDYIEEAKMGQQPLKVEITCDCNASTNFKEQLRAWALGSYSLLDLERNQCWLQIMDKNIVPTTYADDLSYELVRMSITTDASNPKHHQRHPKTKLEIDVSSNSNKQFRLIPELSTIEYYKTGDGTPLIESSALERYQRFPYLSFKQKMEIGYRPFLGKLIKTEPYIQRVSIIGTKVPNEGQHSIWAKGTLIFAYPEGNTTITYRDTIFRGVITKTYREMEVGFRTVVEWGTPDSDAKLFLDHMSMKKDYWCTINIYNLAGELLSQASMPQNWIPSFQIPAEGCIVEQICQKGVLKYMPFSINTSLSFN